MNPRGQPAKSPSSSKISQTQVMQCFEGRLEPVSTSLGYGLGLALVALMLVLLVGVYLLVIGLAGYWTLRYLLENRHMLSEGVFGWFFYLAAGGVGAASIFFLIKPLFRSAEEDVSFQELPPQQQPVLYRFCAQVAQAVGAPEPTRILVSLAPNAGASLGQGVRAVLGKQLCLYIGLPLVRVLTLRQLAGVLAHEMGHFSQHWGMRLGLLIRAMCRWLLRVAYERDHWDERLEQLCSFETWGIFALPAWLARGYVVLTRWLLRGLAWVGVGVAAFFTRQMEYEADLYEAQLVGSRWFVRTMKDLWQLQVAHAEALELLDLFHHDRRLAADFPEMVHCLVEQFRKQEPDAFENKWLPGQRLSWTDTHPTDPQRIRAVERKQSAGLFRDSSVALLPASTLFVGFESLSQQLTEQWYRQVLEDQFSSEWLCPAEELMRYHQQETTYGRSLERYCQGELPIWWFGALLVEEELLDPLRQPLQGLSAEEVTSRLRHHREQVVRHRRDFEQGLELFQEGYAQGIWNQFFQLLTAVAHSKNEGDRLKQRAEEAKQRASELLQRARSLALPWCRSLVERLQLAWGWAEDSPQRAVQLGVEPHLLESVRMLRQLLFHWEDATAVLFQWFLLRFLLEFLEEIANSPNLNPVIHQCEKTALQLEIKVENWLDPFQKLDYPLDEGQAVTVAQWLTRSAEAEEELPPPVRIFARVDVITDRFGMLVGRLMARCCSLAEQVEQALGLPPLPEPEQDEK